MSALAFVAGWFALAFVTGLAAGRVCRWADTAPPSSRLHTFSGLDDR